VTVAEPARRDGELLVETVALGVCGTDREIVSGTYGWPPADRDRLVLLPDLLESYRDRLLAHRHVVRAEVTTTVPLAADRAKAIERSLAQVTRQTVMLETKVDAGILGGVVARIGSIVYDGSVTRQLEKMKQRLADSV